MRFVPGQFLPCAFLTTQPAQLFTDGFYLSLKWYHGLLKAPPDGKALLSIFIVQDWERTAGRLQEQIWGLFIVGVPRASAVMLWVNASSSYPGQYHVYWGHINPSPLATEIETHYVPANDCLHQLSTPEILFKGLVLIYTDSESGPEYFDSGTALNF